MHFLGWMDWFREYDRAVICMTKHTMTEAKGGNEAVNIVCMRLKVTQGKDLSFERGSYFFIFAKEC